MRVAILCLFLFAAISPVVSQSEPECSAVLNALQRNRVSVEYYRDERDWSEPAWFGSASSVVEISAPTVIAEDMQEALDQIKAWTETKRDIEQKLKALYGDAVGECVNQKRTFTRVGYDPMTRKVVTAFGVESCGLLWNSWHVPDQPAKVN